MTNKKPDFLRIELLSDTTFSRGEGTAGVVDTEVERDEFGLPFIGGKTVRGLLRDSWLSMCEHFPKLRGPSERVLGLSRAIDESCWLRIGDAIVPEPISSIVTKAIRDDRRFTFRAVLDGFTSVRRQTAENRETGAPDIATLRSSRVVLRGFMFESRLTWLNGYEPDDEDVRVLALSALATRHGGLLRNRGRGHLRVTINGEVDTTQKHAAEVRG